MKLKKVKMFDDIKGSPHGRDVIEYHANQTYELPPDLAKVFVEELKVAEYLSNHQIEKNKINEINTYSEIQKLLEDKYKERKKLRDEFKSNEEKNESVYNKFVDNIQPFIKARDKLPTLITKINSASKKYLDKNTKANATAFQGEVQEFLKAINGLENVVISFTNNCEKDVKQLIDFKKNAKSLEDNEEQVTEILSKIEKLI